MGDGVHCCWPGQGWSVTRSVCVGVPQCPRGLEPDAEMCVSNDTDGDGVLNAVDKCPSEPEDKDGFEDEDGCPDPDNDKDGILDAVDKCPNQPEDFNHYKDEDGCPDEPERLAGIAAQLGSARRQAAADQAADNERRRIAAEEQRRLAEAAAARDAAEAAEKQKRDAAARASRLTIGVVLVIGGGAAAATSAIFMALGSSQNSTIKSGSLATGSDISAAASKGALYNGLAITTGVIGVLGVGVGMPLWLLNSGPENARVSLTFGPTRVGVEGRF
jgi:hypothetical protein